MTGVSLAIGTLELDKATVIVLDLSSVSKGIGRPVPVVLGRELFDNAIVTLDWKAGSDDPRAARQVRRAGAGAGRRAWPWAAIGSTPFRCRSRACPTVNAHLDLGNGAGAVASEELLGKPGPSLARLPLRQSPQAGGVGGMHATRLVTIGKVAIAGETFARSRPASERQDSNRRRSTSRNAGIGLFKPFKLTMDLGRDRLYLEPLGGPSGLPRDRAGVRTELNGDRLDLVVRLASVARCRRPG